MVPSVYRVLSFRYLLHRWDRGLLIVASIALGVATLISARILNQCIEAAAQDTTTPGGSADFYVTNGEAGVQRSLVEELRAAKIPGIRSVQPLISDRVSLPGLDGRIAVLIGAEVGTQLLSNDNPLKVKFTLDADAPKLQLLPVLAAVGNGDFTRAGELWDKIPARLVLVSKPIYYQWKRTGTNKPFTVRHATREFDCLPIGWVEFEPDSPLASMGNNFIGMSVGQAIQIFHPVPPLGVVAGGLGEAMAEIHSPLKVNRIDLFLERGVDRDKVQRAASYIIGKRAEVRTPDAQRRSTQEIVSSIQIGFLVCAAGALIVGLFLVYNAMAVTVAERRPDIGILRSVGATRGQIIFIFATAATVLGLIGSVLGVPLGILLAEFTLNQFQTELESMFLNPDLNPTRVSWMNSTLAVLGGVSTAVFAALVPAVQAANDDPAHVVRRSSGKVKGIWKMIHNLTCLGLIGCGTSMILLRKELPALVGSIGGMMLVLIGMLLSAPILVSVLVAISRPLVRLWCPISIRLAFDNLSRAPGRTGVVIGALAAGVALIFQTAGVGRSNEEPVVAWIAQVVQADHFVFSGNMTAANSSNAPMAPSVARELSALPAVDSVMAIRYSRPEYNGTIVYLIALDAVNYTRATRQRVPNGLPDLERFGELPGTDDVLVSENFSRRHGVKVGETIELPGPHGPVHLHVIGTVRDYSWSRGTIFMDRKRYAEVFGDDLIDICHVFLKSSRTGTAAHDTALEDYAIEKGLFVTDRDALRKFLSELINRAYLLVYLQQVVIGVVAALGVVTSLLISVLQRKRELGLLLAVGATPGQVLRSVLAEAALMGIFGTFLGILIGLPMEWYVLKVVFFEESGFVLDVVFPWKQAFGIAAIAVFTATIAGLLPAIRAIQTRIPDALQYE
ncbi:MAG TPA: FtsX-like permease family protein [Gemmata sp.]|jgi:putative ABC transport system permease protein|nr:FtsX-like permease family protein [Gemmata sp.]